MQLRFTLKCIQLFQYMRECIGVWDAMLQTCYGHLLRWTCDERGGFTKARTGACLIGTSKITQTEILRSYNETREFRERHHAGHHARKTSSRWSEETVDRWYRSMGERSLVEMVRQAENRKGYRCLVHEAAYARTSGTASWWYGDKCFTTRKVHFWCKKMVGGQKFAWNAKVQSVVRQRLGQQPASFFASGIKKFIDRWGKFLNKLGSYVEKRSIKVSRLKRWH